ncbi:hypothetical protein PRZ48_009100 [Zasmidium cellare]|uniref:SnoaL-like domain-containing protein n=1 Tax=Zasmidium cellare TaxID=395010 RepID=A0ABR0EIE9_ZASCE|nr:hypothetical protein PRZ48_009100 [Zasmidium cellare]
MTTEENLKAWTLDIVAKINARDAHTAVTTYASPDYTWETTEDNGSITKLNATDMFRLRDIYFSKLSPDVYAEVRSTEVNLDKELWGATV